MKKQAADIVPVAPEVPATEITKMQWAEVEKNLRECVYASVKFRLETGEVIEVAKRFTAENRLSLVVYVNGEYSTAWGYSSLGEFLPLVKTIWRRKTRKPCASIVRRLSGIKGGKAYLKRKENAYLYEIVEYWVPYFDTAKSLVTQFKKIDGIQIMDEEVLNHG